MFGITNTPRPFSWGSTTALAEFRGTTPTGQPEAELWFGDHPGSPSVRIDDSRTLNTWEAETGATPLPFLLKILAVNSPLSIQVHPTLSSARAGFERENAAGISIDAPNRNYRDNNHKPEIIRAITTFSALCGFRPRAERDAILGWLTENSVPGSAGLALIATGGLRELVSHIVGHGTLAVELASGLSTMAMADAPAAVADAVNTARSVVAHFPGDPGAVLALFLNHVTIQPGEALAVPAGTPHAYLSGMGVEVMASSDNVLRGGCTNKHIDADEFLAVLDWTEGSIAPIETVDLGDARLISAGFGDCELLEYTVHGPVASTVSGPAIALVLDGSIGFGSQPTEMSPRGSALFIESGDRDVALSGQGLVVVARAPQPAN